MNRAERRRIFRQAKKPVATYTMTDETIQGVSRRASTKATNTAFVYMLGIPIEILATEVGWSAEECNWFVDRIINKYNEMDLDKVKQLVETVEKYSGMRLIPEEGDF